MEGLYFFYLSQKREVVFRSSSFISTPFFLLSFFLLQCSLFSFLRRCRFFFKVKIELGLFLCCCFYFYIKINTKEIVFLFWRAMRSLSNVSGFNSLTIHECELNFHSIQECIAFILNLSSTDPSHIVNISAIAPMVRLMNFILASRWSPLRNSLYPCTVSLCLYLLQLLQLPIHLLLLFYHKNIFELRLILCYYPWL